MFRVIFKSAIFFFVPGFLLLYFDWASWGGLNELGVTIATITGRSLLAIGLLYFIVMFRKLKRSEYENAAREKLKTMAGDKPLAYEAVESLTENDIRLLHRQIYYLVAVMVLFSCIPAAFLFFLMKTTGLIYTCL